MDTNIIILDETAKNSNSSSVKIFENPEFGNVRVFIDKSNDPWFCLSDICKILEIKNSSDCKSRLDQRGIVLTDTPTYNQYGTCVLQKITFINEKNLYKIIMRSDKSQAEPFQDWVCGEILPSIRKTGKYFIKEETLSISKEEYDLRMKEINVKTAELFLEIGNRTSIPEYKNVLNSYAANALAGKEILALPEVDEKTFSATEIGNILGVSANKIGKISNFYKMKTPEYGKFFYDKSRYSNKEVETFRYYNKAIDKFRELLK